MNKSVSLNREAATYLRALPVFEELTFTFLEHSPGTELSIVAKLARGKRVCEVGFRVDAQTGQPSNYQTRQVLEGSPHNPLGRVWPVVTHTTFWRALQAARQFIEVDQTHVKSKAGRPI